jgi:hypothetical protein
VPCAGYLLRDTAQGLCKISLLGVSPGRAAAVEVKKGADAAPGAVRTGFVRCSLWQEARSGALARERVEGWLRRPPVMVPYGRIEGRRIPVIGKDVESGVGALMS